jgi:hypothetical protein
MQIHEKIIAIMGEIGAIAKDKRNTQGTGYNYRGIDGVMNALSPLFIKHGVFLSPEVIEKIREERTSRSGGNLIYSVLTVKYTFYAADGSSVVATVVGEGMDSGDKASNKALAVAMKYAMFQVFCIPTEEMVDPDSESHEVIPKPAPPKKQEPTPERKTPKPAALICENCGSTILGTKTHTAQQMATGSKNAFGKFMCSVCTVEANAKLKASKKSNYYDETLQSEDAGDRV